MRPSPGRTFSVIDLRKCRFSRNSAGLHLPDMCIKGSHFRPQLALLFHGSPCSRFSIVITVALVLLITTSGGQLIPSSQAAGQPSLQSNKSLSSSVPKDLKDYVIYSFMESPSSDSENEKVRLHLGMMLAPADVQEYGGDYTGVEFWRVAMNDIQHAAFTSSNPRVSARPTRKSFARVPLLMTTQAQIYENTQLLYHEDLQLSQSQHQNVSDADQIHSEVSNGTKVELGVSAQTIYQSDAPPDLKVVSWAPDVPFAKVDTYAYDSKSGGKAIIYLIENGIDGRNRVSTH